MLFPILHCTTENAQWLNSHLVRPVRMAGIHIISPSNSTYRLLSCKYTGIKWFLCKVIHWSVTYSNKNLKLLLIRDQVTKSTCFYVMHCSNQNPGSHSVVQAGLWFTVNLQLWLPEWWDYRCVPSHLVTIVLIFRIQMVKTWMIIFCPGPS